MPASRAQQGVFSFRSYGQESGLRNLAIYSLAQGPEGFLWVGTEDGLYRYDGQRFQQTGKGLKASTIWGLAIGRDGQPWVSVDDGLFRLEGGVFQPIAGLAPGRQYFFHVSNQDSLIVGDGDRLIERGAAGGEWQTLKVFPERVRTGWASDDHGLLIVTTEHRLWQRQAGAWSSLELPAGSPPGRIFRDSQGRIWMRDRATLWRMQGWGQPWVNLSRLLPGNAINPNTPVEDHLGRVWVGSSKGLLCLDGDESWVLDEAKGLPGGWAGVPFVDREGSLWVGSEGMQRLQGRFLWTSFGTHQGLPSPTVWDIGRAQDGRVYACTDQGAAVQEGERWKVLPETAKKSIFAGGEDGQGGIWFGGTSVGRAFNVLYRMAFRSHRFETISLEPCKASSVILSMAPDGQGGIYAASIDQGVFRVKRDGRRWQVQSLPFPDSGAVERVNGLVLDRQGNLWAAAERGLYVLEAGRWQRLGVEQGLLGANCNSVTRDARGQVWVAFVDVHGINRLGKAGGAWKAVETLTQPAALFSDVISSITFDGNNVLWLGTDGGMKRWDGAHLESFGKGEGLPGMDPTANAISPAQDGGVWQGFSNGVGHFNPVAFTGATAPPSARILEATGARAALSLDPGQAPSAVPDRDRTLSFRFAAVSFLNESRIIHQVRLVGLENEWRDTRLGEARYPALPMGSYRFEVRSRYDDGESGPVAQVSFRVLAPWWGSWWFLGLVGISLASLGRFWFQWRVRNLSRRNLQLEAMVTARTEALEHSKVELEGVNQALALANLALEELSLVDPLTGLHNRRFLDLALPTDALQATRVFREMVDAGKDPLEPKEDLLLFMMDIDRFKQVNDTFGHLAGDAVLRQLAQSLKSATRATDSLVRWGGEEFLLVARRARRGGAAKVAQNILEAVRSMSFELPSGERIHKQISIGFTAVPLHPMKPEFGGWQMALELADQCLYAAKTSGRDRWVGALLKVDQDPAPLEGLDSWDIAKALELGLVDVACSEPDFLWPSAQARAKGQSGSDSLWK